MGTVLGLLQSASATNLALKIDILKVEYLLYQHRFRQPLKILAAFARSPTKSYISQRSLIIELNLSFCSSMTHIETTMPLVS